MQVLIVGNILKDVYLNLDTRTEQFEPDQHHTEWLNLGFDASEHFFFNHSSNLGGAAVSYEVLSKLGLTASVADSDLQLTEDGLTSHQLAAACRYILLSEHGVSYFTPTKHPTTHFSIPTSSYDYLFIDRSASLDQSSIKQIHTYLNNSPNTKLILYLTDSNTALHSLTSRAALIFHEATTPTDSTTPSLDPDKTINISEHRISYRSISEQINIKHVDVFTHLSVYSIIAATILGCFILGYSFEESFKLARANLEKSKLNATLTLEDLLSLSNDLTPTEDLRLIAANLVLHPKGILAADESGGSIHKKFEQLNITDTYDHRRDYRNLLFTTPDLDHYVNGVILFDETARQVADNGQTFVDYLIGKRIIPGIKVDQGLAPLNPLEHYTKGLDGLDQRLAEYYQMGLRFAKWRAAFDIHLSHQGKLLTPTDEAINQNCTILAKYAAACQAAGLVPIVEPEVVYDGYYSIEDSASVTSKILRTLFSTLSSHHVDPQACILKCNMVLAGKHFHHQSSPDEIGLATATVLRNNVPPDLAGVVFLSGGQTPTEATTNLASIVRHGPFPWPVTFSFARALQEPALSAWAGDNRNIEKAHQAFLDRLIENCKALS